MQNEDTMEWYLYIGVRAPLKFFIFPRTQIFLRQKNKSWNVTNNINSSNSNNNSNSNNQQYYFKAH